MTTPKSLPPTVADLRTLRDAEELTQAKSLARASANGRFVIGTVALVSSLLTGFGAVAVTGSGLAAWQLRFVSISIALAASAVVVCLSALILRTRSVAIGDLNDVRRWYKAEFKRTRRIAVGGVLLLAALTLAGSVGAYAAWTAAEMDPRPSMNLTLSSVDTGKVARVSVDLAGLSAGTEVSVELHGLDGSREPYLTASLVIGSDGEFSFDQRAEVQPEAAYELVVAVGSGSDTRRYRSEVHP